MTQTQFSQVSLSLKKIDLFFLIRCQLFYSTPALQVEIVAFCLCTDQWHLTQSVWFSDHGY